MAKLKRLSAKPPFSYLNYIQIESDFMGMALNKIDFISYLTGNPRHKKINSRIYGQPHYEELCTAGIKRQIPTKDTSWCI